MTQQLQQRARLRQAFCWLLPLVVVVALGACREEEQGRSLAYEKGTYQGAVDQGLDPATREALRHRIRNQRAQ